MNDISKQVIPYRKAMITDCSVYRDIDTDIKPISTSITKNVIIIIDMIS
jgi:hypothetical protein